MVSTRGRFPCVLVCAHRHVSEQNVIEEIGIATFEAIKVNVFLERDRLGAQLFKTALAVVCVGKVRRKPGDRHGVKCSERMRTRGFIGGADGRAKGHMKTGTREKKQSENSAKT